MKMDGLYPAVFSHPANFTGIARFKASISTHPPLIRLKLNLVPMKKDKTFSKYPFSDSIFHKLNSYCPDCDKLSNSVIMMTAPCLWYEVSCDLLSSTLKRGLIESGFNKDGSRL